MDFSESHSQEVIRFFWSSVYIPVKSIKIQIHLRCTWILQQKYKELGPAKLPRYKRILIRYTRTILQQKEHTQETSFHCHFFHLYITILTKNTMVPVNYLIFYTYKKNWTKILILCTHYKLKMKSINSHRSSFVIILQIFFRGIRNDTLG